MNSNSYRNAPRISLLFAILLLLIWMLFEPSARLLLQNQFDAYAMHQPHARAHGHFLSGHDAQLKIDDLAVWIVTYQYTVPVSEDVHRTYQRQQLVFTTNPAHDIAVGRPITVWYLLANPQMARWTWNDQPPRPLSLAAMCGAIALYLLFPLISLSFGLAATFHRRHHASQWSRQRTPVATIPMRRNRKQHQMQNRTAKQEQAAIRRLLETIRTSQGDDQTHEKGMR